MGRNARARSPSPLLGGIRSAARRWATARSTHPSSGDQRTVESRPPRPVGLDTSTRPATRRTADVFSNRSVRVDVTSRAPDGSLTLKGPHECDHRCRPHHCRPLGASAVRQIHWILSGAPTHAVRWRRISISAAELTEPPCPRLQTLGHPRPRTAARIVSAAWDEEPMWGVLVWVAMTTGMRRGELCALRRQDFDAAAGVLTRCSQPQRHDRRSVVNPCQAKLIDTVGRTPRSGPRLVASCACMYTRAFGQRRRSPCGAST